VIGIYWGAKFTNYISCIKLGVFEVSQFHGAIYIGPDRPCCHSNEKLLSGHIIGYNSGCIGDVPDSCTKVEILGAGNVMVSFKLDPNWPLQCWHGNEIFACCHKSSASVKQQRVTITLGFATLSSLSMLLP